MINDARAPGPPRAAARLRLTEPAGRSDDLAAGVGERDLQTLPSHEQRLPTGPEEIRGTPRARFPADDITPAANTVIVRLDPEPVAAPHRTAPGPQARPAAARHADGSAAWGFASAFPQERAAGRRPAIPPH